MNQQDALDAASVNPASAGNADASKGVIAPGLVIRGEISGEEDLLVSGRVEGNISLPASRVCVGENGRVHAGIHARVVDVWGRVEGDLRGDEQVNVHATGDVVGNISAPRVSLAEGCRFRGSVDMDVKSSASDGRRTVSRPIAVAAGDR